MSPGPPDPRHLPAPRGGLRTESPFTAAPRLLTFRGLPRRSGTEEKTTPPRPRAGAGLTIRGAGRRRRRPRFPPARPRPQGAPANPPAPVGSAALRPQTETRFVETPCLEERREGNAGDARAVRAGVRAGRTPRKGQFSKLRQTAWKRLGSAQERPRGSATLRFVVAASGDKAAVGREPAGGRRGFAGRARSLELTGRCPGRPLCPRVPARGRRAVGLGRAVPQGFQELVMDTEILSAGK